jgi:hypothetical protein
MVLRVTNKLRKHEIRTRGGREVRAGLLVCCCTAKNLAMRRKDRKRSFDSSPSPEILRLIAKFFRLQLEA